ncbi:hypothetical protein N7537_002856 [Penicillium hordei]|uniref:Uncharacterized protein n=1 Tax=Penicillium hordei TaxID=40994 RepID=A0AAD6EJR3_9EURO|nr:uncharacterized protein N7537_002856 [Penicillium hordei]KAJ5617742.1 hypothetical protein N7537_002856 [Penicillium hordei]
MDADLTEKGLGLGSEMLCMKSVQIPQPIYHAQEWNPEELNHRVNSDEAGVISSGSDSIWT